MLANFLCAYSNFDKETKKSLFDGLVVVAVDKKTQLSMIKLGVPTFFDEEFWEGLKEGLFRNSLKVTDPYHDYVVKRTTFIRLLLAYTSLDIVVADADSVILHDVLPLFQQLKQEYSFCDAFWTAEAVFRRLNFSLSHDFMSLNGGFYLVRNTESVFKLYFYWSEAEKRSNKIKEQEGLHVALANTRFVAVPVDIQSNDTYGNLLPPERPLEFDGLKICILRDLKRFPNRRDVEILRTGFKYLERFGTLDGIIVYHPAGHHGAKMRKMKSVRAWKLDDARQCRARKVYEWSKSLPIPTGI